MDSTGTAAIAALGRYFIQKKPHTELYESIYINVVEKYIYSVYASPSASQDDFKIVLANLAKELHGQNPLNARALEWGSRNTD